MLTNINPLKHSTLHATDGEIGRVDEFYFDDETWAIRYLVIDTGNWLAHRRVLILPAFLRQADWDSKRLEVNLTKHQIENSPDIDTHQPVSRSHEADYMDYYGSAYYWGSSHMLGAGLAPPDLAEAAIPFGPPPVVPPPKPEDFHLRSTDAVTGYHIEATDGEIGHVSDFIVDTETWAIRYLEVSTRNWLSGETVRIVPDWIGNIDWMESKVTVTVNRDAIRNAPRK